MTHLPTTPKLVYVVIYQCCINFLQGWAKKFQDLFLILCQMILQCCFLECYVTQQDRVHMDSLDKLCLVLLYSGSSDDFVSSTLSRRKNGAYDGTDSKCENLC